MYFKNCEKVKKVKKRKGGTYNNKDNQSRGFVIKKTDFSKNSKKSF